MSKYRLALVLIAALLALVAIVPGSSDATAAPAPTPEAWGAQTPASGTITDHTKTGTPPNILYEVKLGESWRVVCEHVYEEVRRLMDDVGFEKLYGVDLSDENDSDPTPFPPPVPFDPEHPSDPPPDGSDYDTLRIGGGVVVQG